MIELKNVCKHYKVAKRSSGLSEAVKSLFRREYTSIQALDNISFTVRDGEAVGYIGPNGAGKSTTMNILTGYLSSNIGSVKIGEYDILEDPMKAKAKIGYLPENPPLYMDMTVKEYLDFVYDLKKVKIPRKRHIDEICGIVKITDVYNRIIKNLSKGYKQRVGLAQALVGNPEVLILDEPTVGLDPKQIIDIRKLIKDLGKKHTVILSSHILPEIQAVCDRVIIINRGRIVADDTAENLSATMSTDHRHLAIIEGPENEVYKTLSTIPGMVEVTTLGNRGNGMFEYSLEAKEGTDIRRELFKRMSGRNWPIMGLKSTELTLEDIFLKLTSSDISVPVASAETKKKIAESVLGEQEEELEEGFDNFWEEQAEKKEEDVTDEENGEEEAAEETTAEESNNSSDENEDEQDKKDNGGEQ